MVHQLSKFIYGLWFFQNITTFLRSHCDCVFTREVVDNRNLGKFLKKFFQNQRLFQWLFVKSTKISNKNLNIWNFNHFLQKLKIFVNKNTIKMENIKVTPHQRLFSVTVFSDFLKFLKSSWTNENPDYPPDYGYFAS